MIVRSILENPDLADNFDHFNDTEGTLYWLRSRQPSIQCNLVIQRLEESYRNWNPSKFPFTLRDTVLIQMPKGAKTIGVENQNGSFCLLASADADREIETRHFRIVGTTCNYSLSLDLLNSGRHVGTILHSGLSYHLFEG